jgi:photosystem II stability/assembly factor-like uncharacterized protein
LCSQKFYTITFIWDNMKRHQPKLPQIIFFELFVIVCIIFVGSSFGQLAANKSANGRNDDWGMMGYGGGGAMFYPTVSPYNPDYAFVSCDMGGSYVTYNGGQSWRIFNLRSSVDFYVFDPLDSNTVYANSLALFKSTDRGKTWGVMYPAATEINGIVSKGDHAQEVLITKDSTVRKILAFAVDPEDSKKLYAAISIDKSVSFYTSDDGGINWMKEHKLEDGAKNIFLVPSSSKNNRSIYITGLTTISARQNGNWKVNKGPVGVSTMTEYSGGFDKQKNKFIIYSISGKSYFNPKGDKSVIYYSEDGGENWENRESGLVSLGIPDATIPELRTIATSAAHPNVVYVSYNNLKIHTDTTCIGVAMSEDYGKTWQLSWKDLITKGGNKPSKNFKSGWINDRFGPTWGENPFSIGVSPTNPGVCYATDFGRTVKTADGGKTWEQAYTKRKQGAGWSSLGLEVTTGYSVVFDPFNNNNVFICNTDVGLMQSRDGGESWLSITQNNGIPRSWENSTYWLAFDPEVKGKAWASMSGTHDLPRPKMFRKSGTGSYKGGIVMTEDGGKSWKPISADIGEAAMTHILIDPSSSKQARTLYACAFGKGVYKSVDGGKTWKQKNKGIDGKEPFAWRIVRRDKDGVLFLVVNRRSEDGSIDNDMDGAIYRSDDKAETWTKMTLPSGTNGPTSIMTDNHNNNRIVLSAWGRDTRSKLSPDIGGGIFLSDDDGKTWLHVLQKDQHIHDITYDPRSKTYYACGFNEGAYRSEDFAKTWKRIKGYNFKWGKRVDFDPRDPSKIFVITFGGGVWYGPAKGDENAIEDIVTPVVAFDQK